MAEPTTRYQLLERIGVGGMAEVFRAQVMGAAGFAKTVAIKRILPTFSQDLDFVGRFVDEARLTARLQHPNICQVLDFGVMEDRYFIAMEFVEGLDLAKALSTLDTMDRLLPPELCLTVLAGVLRGLGHAHNATDGAGQRLGIVHRDVSPHNVLLSINGDVKLGDFGAATAKAELRQAHTMDNVALGKLLYMAPEQRRGEPVDERTDVHGAGVLLIEMILGSAVFRRAATEGGPDPRSLAGPIAARFPPHVAKRMTAIVARATEPRRDQRYADAASMLADVEACSVELASGSTGDRLARLVRTLRAEAGQKRDRGSSPGARSSRLQTAALEGGSPATLGVVLEASLRRISIGELDLISDSHEGLDRPATEELETCVRAAGSAAEEELETSVLLGSRAPSGGHPVEAGGTQVLSEGDLEPVGLPELYPGGSGPQTLSSTLVRPDRAAVASEDELATVVRSAARDHAAPRPDAAEDELATRVRPGASERSGAVDDELATRVRPGGPSDGSSARLAPPAVAASDIAHERDPFERGRAGRTRNPGLSASGRAAAEPRESDPPSDAPPPWLVEPDGAPSSPRSGSAAPLSPESAGEPERGSRTALVRVPARRRARRVRLGLVALALAAGAAGVFAMLVVRWHASRSASPWPPPSVPAPEGRPAEGARPPPPLGSPVEPVAELPGPPVAEPTPVAPGPPVAAPVPTAPDPPPAAPGPASGAAPQPGPSKAGAGGAASRRTGSLTILAEPAGRAYVDGRLVAPSTPSPRIEVEAGSHEVRVVFSRTGETTTVRVRVMPGEDRVLRLRPER